MLHSYDSSKASHENSSVKLGKSPQQGGGVKNFIIFPSLGGGGGPKTWDDFPSFTVY